MARAGLLTCLALAAPACSDDGADHADCDVVGDSEACACDDGAPGTRVCLASGAFTPCDCARARTVPCSAPGVSFPCACGAGLVGEEICLDDGTYTACDCDVPLDEGADAGVDGPPEPPMDVPQAPVGCPAPLTCVTQMGVRVCADEGGLPPVCDDDAECAARGLTAARCLDPLGAGVTFCLQTCD